MLVSMTFKFIMDLLVLTMQFLTVMEVRTAQDFFEQTSISSYEENYFQGLKVIK